MKPRLLDLFCGAGGATRGYQQAGFHVVGVDHEPQPNYVGDEFHQADALEFPLDGFDAIHASPPCQAFTQMSAKWRGNGGKADSHLDLLTPTLAMLRQLTVLWVVENVVGARRFMRPTIQLHGGMFGLGVHRPRLFESNVLLLATRAPRTVQPIGVYGTKPDGRMLWGESEARRRYRNNGNWRTAAEPKKSIIRAASSLTEAQAAMGIGWMTWDELRESIPPAYTQWIGEQLMAHLTARGAVPR